jgi:hypothetical protein
MPESRRSEHEFVEKLRARPFVPFRVEVSDGTHYTIKHPEMVIPTGYAEYTAVPRKKGHGFARVETVAMEHIVTLIPLPRTNESA